MKVTKAWIEKNFGKFNKEYFKNELPTPNFLCCNTRKMLGQCGAKNWRAERPNFYIKISNYFDRTEKEFQNTLIHEMIHLYFQSHKEWKVGHGWKFQQMARTFDKYGWNIHTTEQGFKSKTTNGTIPTRLIMSFTDITTNNVWLCCVADDDVKISRFNRIIGGNKKYTNIRWYTTNSDKFGGMKISHKNLGGKVVSPQTFANEWECLLTPTQILSCR